MGLRGEERETFRISAFPAASSIAPDAAGEACGGSHLSTIRHWPDQPNDDDDLVATSEVTSHAIVSVDMGRGVPDC